MAVVDKANMANMVVMKHRLKEIMRQKGITQEQLADMVEAHPMTISKLVRGTMRLSDVWVEKIATALNISPAELFEVPRTVPVVGYVGAGDEIIPIDDHALGAGLDEVELPLPLGKDAVAVIVRGNSMYPAYREGDIIVYEKKFEGDLTPLIGRECIVRLEDGRSYVKELARGSGPGLWTLISHNAPPIPDVRLAWAAPVTFVKRKW